MKSEVICTLNRELLESAKVNLYEILFAFRDELVDHVFERDGKRYCVSSVEITDNKIVMIYWNVDET